MGGAARRDHKALHDKAQSAIKKSKEEKEILDATRKLRASKGCMDSVTCHAHSGSAGHVDK